jgi:hypothetical protein
MFLMNDATNEGYVRVRMMIPMDDGAEEWRYHAT